MATEWMLVVLAIFATSSATTYKDNDKVYAAINAIDRNANSPLDGVLIRDHVTYFSRNAQFLATVNVSNHVLTYDLASLGCCQLS